MKRTSLGGGAYKSPDGRFWARPTIAGKRTWRLLHVTTQRNAIKQSCGTTWRSDENTVAAAADLWVQSDCPNARMERRPWMVADTKLSVANLVEYFGKFSIHDIKLSLLRGYADWRMKKCKRFPGSRTVDKDLVILSGILTCAVHNGQLEHNPIKSHRPRYRKDADIRHARESMPPSATVIHRLADHFFDEVKSEVIGWLTLFAMFTGCRRSELLKLRLDAPGIGSPGFVQWRPADQPASDPAAPLGLLHIERSKHGTNPEVMIGPDFAAAIANHRRWHTDRFPDNPHYFPGRSGAGSVDISSFGHALRRACIELKLPHISPHGFRAYYVTKRRSDGIPDQMIAAEIGDATVALMATTYGQRPKSWIGGEPLGWLPKEGLPAWARWGDEKSKVVML